MKPLQYCFTIRIYVIGEQAFLRRINLAMTEIPVDAMPQLQSPRNATLLSYPTMKIDHNATEGRKDGGPKG